MQTINLYRYVRADGGVTVSTIRPEVEYAELYRLVADEGMVLTDGVAMTSCVDTADVSAWTEIADTQSDGAQAETPELTAEIMEKAKAYDLLMGTAE